MSRERCFGPGVPSVPDAPSLGGDCDPRSALPVYQGRPRHLEAHLGRLEAGAAASGQPAGWVVALRAEIEGWLSLVHEGQDSALRLRLHTASGLLSARLEPLPTAPRPCRLALMPHPLGARREDLLIRHKGLGGPWSIDILCEARRLGAEDALLFWPDGTLAETALAAVGVELGGVLLLPPPQGRVASLAERLDLPGWAENQGLGLVQAPLTPNQARQGQLWCMNALRGIWPATLL